MAGGQLRKKATEGCVANWRSPFETADERGYMLTERLHVAVLKAERDQLDRCLDTPHVSRQRAGCQPEEEAADRVALAD